MSDPNSPEEEIIPKDKIPEPPPVLNTEEASAAVRSLFEDDTIEDPEDKRIIEAALAFIENPTADLKKIQDHSLGISMVLMTYPEIDQQPPAISNVHRRLYVLESQHHIDSIKTKLEKDDPDIEEVQKLFQAADNSARVLSGQFDDNTFREAIQSLAQQDFVRSLFLSAPSKHIQRIEDALDSEKPDIPMMKELIRKTESLTQFVAIYYEKDDLKDRVAELHKNIHFLDVTTTALELYIKLLETELAKDEPDKEKVNTLNLNVYWAKVPLGKYFKKNALNNRTTELWKKIGRPEVPASNP